MGVFIFLFLVVFWAGAALIVLSASGMISVPIWLILIIWIIALVVFVAVVMAFMEKAEKYEEQQHFMYELDRINQAGAEKVRQMKEKEHAMRSPHKNPPD